MGSRSKHIATDLAYIAGFLDGDGSLMLQVKKRSDTKSGVRFMATICWYQDARHEQTLYWIREVLNKGYVSRRKDGISELRVNGFNSVYEILDLLEPFVRLKRRQLLALKRACNILIKSRLSSLTKLQKKKLLEIVFEIRNQNYTGTNALNKQQLQAMLGLTP